MVNVQLCALMLTLVKNSTTFTECFESTTSLVKSAASLLTGRTVFLDLKFFFYSILLGFKALLSDAKQ